MVNKKQGWHGDSQGHRDARMKGLTADMKYGAKDFDGSTNKVSNDKSVVMSLSEQNDFINDYIFERIDTEGYDVVAITDKEKLQFLYDTFKSEYGYMITRVGSQKAYQEWLQGLPSAFNIDFYNVDILKVAKQMGSLSANPTEKQEDKIIDNWWSYVANKTFQLFRKYKINQ